MEQKAFQQPLWLVGFRPFFTLALIAGAVYPLLWALVFTGHLVLPTQGLSMLQWHAHEMIFGFGWAVLGGFLLTASKNWVSIRGLHGAPLALAAAAWIFERVFIWYYPAQTNPFTSLILPNLFLLYVIGYIVYSLIRYRKQDSFKDNYFFLIALPLFLLAKILLLSPEHFVAGYLLAIGIFRLAFVVMFERTLTQFMKNAAGVQILRNRWLDGAIKFSVLFSAFEAFLPIALATFVLVLAGVLLTVRFVFWKPVAAFRRFELAVMYVGYLGLTAHLFLEAFRLNAPSFGVGTLSLHAFTFLCMGVVIPAMMIRISQGHTGRKILFTWSDKLAIYLMIAGAGFRLVATQLAPAHYSLWIALAAVGWSLCFAIVGFRLTPFLWAARIDGKVH